MIIKLVKTIFKGSSPKIYTPKYFTPIISRTFARRINKSKNIKNDEETNKQSNKELELTEEEFQQKMAEEELKGDDLEYKATLEKLNSNEFENQLDSLIMQKLKEGKTDKQIMAEMIGLSPTQKPKSDQDKNIEDVNISEKYTLLQARTVLLKKVIGVDPEIDKPRTMDDIEKELSMLEQMQEIFKDSKMEPLKELGYSQLKKYGMKLTPQEKDELALKKAMLEGQLMAASPEELKNIPRDLEPNLILSDRSVYKELDLTQKDLQSQNKNQNNLANKKMMTEEEKRTQLKLHSSTRISHRAEDKEFKELAQKDAMESDKLLDRYIPESKPGDRYIKTIKDKGDVSIYEKIEKETVRIAKKFNLDLAESKLLMKDFVIRLKELDEQNKEIKKRLELKKKKKEMNKLVKDINAIEYKDDIDYRDPKKKSKPKIKKDIFGSVENIEELEEEVEEIEIPKKELDYQKHKSRTHRNLERYIDQLFSVNDQRLQTNVLLGHNICIEEIIVNNALTVVNVVWTLITPYGDAFPEDHPDIPKVSKNLEKYSKYARGKLCRDMGFKYAPELRFFHSRTPEILKEFREKMTEALPDIVKQNLKDGKVTGDDIKKQERLKYDDYQATLEKFVTEFSHNDIIKSKKNRLYDEEGKRIRNNKTEDGKKKKYQKQNKGETFWNSLAS